MWNRSDRISALSFFLLLAAFGLLCGWDWLSSVFLAASVHEIGHLSVLRLCGAGEGRLKASLAGLEWQRTGRRMLSYGEELLAILAGPGMNLLMALAAARFSAETGWQYGYFLAGTQLVLGGFNLLPILPLDGARAAEVLLSWLFDPVLAFRVVRCGSLAASSMLLLFALWLFALTGSAFLLIGAVMLLVLSLRELGLVKAKQNS